MHDFDADLNDAATEEIEFLGSKCRQLEQEKVSVLTYMLTYSACFQKFMFIVCIVSMLNSYLFPFSSPSSCSCVFLLLITDSAPPPPSLTHTHTKFQAELLHRMDAGGDPVQMWCNSLPCSLAPSVIVCCRLSLLCMASFTTGGAPVPVNCSRYELHSWGRGALQKVSVSSSESKIESCWPSLNLFE